MKCWQILVGIGVVVLLLGGAALAQPPSTPPATGAAAQPPAQPPDQPPAPTGEGDETDETPDGPPGEGATVPGARPGVTGGDSQDPNAPDDNRGFSADQFPEDIRTQLEAIMPKGEPSSDGKLSMAFSKTEIEDFLQFLSSESGYTILPPADLSGQITIVSRVEVTLDDAFSILEAWLRLRSFTTLRDDTRKIITVIPLSKARMRPREVRGPNVPIDLADPNDIVTQIVQLRHVEAAKVAELITPLVDAEWAQVTASADLNALLITDTAANIERLMLIIDELDQELLAEPVTVEVIPLSFAPAKETADLLNTILGQSNQLPAEMLQRFGIDPSTIQQGPQGFIGETQKLKVQADQRTNSLVVLASPARIELVKKIVEQLDIDTSAKVSYRVFQLKSADATDVAEMLNQIFEQPQGGPGSSTNRRGGFMDFMFDPFGSSRRSSEGTKTVSSLKENVVVADTRTNSVIVTAAEGNMKAFEDMINQLDSNKSLSELTRVYRLENAMAADLSEVLANAFSGSRRRGGGGFLEMIFGGSSRSSSTGPLQLLSQITVTAEEKSNSLIVTAPPQAFEMVDQIIEDLDQPRKQVYISVIIADVTLNDELRYGVEWDWFTKSNPSLSGTSNFGLSGWDQGIRWGIIGDSMQGFLEALSEKTSIRVISTPSIMTLDNAEGTITSGREITVKTGQRESTGGSITDITDRVTAAITLQVTPHISRNSCRLSITQTIDDIGELDTYGNPAINKREATAEELVGTGETVVLGGIIQEDVRVTRQSVPVLSEIPLIGQLFKSKNTTVRRSELMVFLTPYVVEDQDVANRHGESVQSIRRAAEEDLRRRFPDWGSEVTDALEAARIGGAPTGSTPPDGRPTGDAPAVSERAPASRETDNWPPITGRAGRR